MTPADRDRLVTLKKAKKKLITQREAAAELGVSIRQVKRLLYALKKHGDKAVIHGLRGKPSKRRIEEEVEKEAVKLLSADVYRGFGPTLAAEYLGKRHGIAASRETVRQWMMRGKLWQGKTEKVKEVHLWRPRRSRLGELVQWDTSEHDWLEGRGEKLYLIAMIDDATSRLYARFVRHDSTEENMKLVWSYVEKFGRPLAFYTDKASLFQTAGKRKRDETGVDKDAVWSENSIYLKQREIIPGVVDNETTRCQSAWTRMARKLDPPNPKFNQGLHLRPKLRDLRAGECPGNSADQTGDAKIVDTAHTSGAPAVHD